MFEHLDDPGSPAPPPAEVVAARGLAIRNRRRYAAAGAAATLGVALLLVTTLLGSGPRPDALEIAEDPSPGPSETLSPEPLPSESASAPASASASPAATRTAQPSAAPAPGATVPAFDGAHLTPPREPFPGFPPCSAEQVAAGHPAGTAPPAGIQVTAAITSWTTKTADQGGGWSVTMVVRNNGTAPVTFEDRGSVGRAFHDGRYAGGGELSTSPPPTPTPVSRTLAPGQQVEVSVTISTLDCTGGWQHLPHGAYELSVALRTDQGNWYAPDVEGWLADRMNGNRACFTHADAAHRAPPIDGLVLSVEGVPSAPPRPDSGFVARLVVTNTSNRTRELVDLEPGRHFGYFMDPGQRPDTVVGGWTVGQDGAAQTYRLAPGERRGFDVAVRAEGCQVEEPMFHVVDLVVGMVTVKDGRPYVWNSARLRVRYPG